MKRVIAICILLLFASSGCAWFKTKEEETAQELSEQGLSAITKKQYTLAIEKFEKLKTWYPFSDLVVLADYKIADSYYRLKRYDEAILTYNDFEKLHPNNEKMPYVLYQVGLCYLNQTNTIDRDPTPTQDCIKAFKRLIGFYPDSEYANKAEEHLITCQKDLATHEFSVGFFYYKTKQYKAALYRFKTILAEYPDLGVNHKALKYISLCEAHLEQAEQTEQTEQTEQAKEQIEKELLSEP